MSDQARLKLGELLVRRKLVDRAQLLAALTRQHGTNERLGSLLVEQGHLAVDDLAAMLSLQTGYPAATTADFGGIARECIGVVPQRFCIRHSVLPLRMDARSLHLAAMDPNQLNVFDQLSASLGLRILPHIAPQVLLRHHIQRFHAAAVLADAADARKAARSTPVGRDTLSDLSGHAPPLGLPIRVPAPAPAPRPKPTPDSEPDLLDLVFLDEAMGQNPWADDDWDLEIDDSDIAAFDAADLDIDISFESSDGEPTKPADVITQLRSAAHPDAVMQCLLQPLMPDTTMMALLMPRGEVATALAAWGSELSVDQVRALVVPLSTPSLISAGLEHRAVQIGEPAGDTVQAMISTYLRTPAADVSYVVPVCIGDRVINLVYAQTTSGPQELDLAALSSVAAHAAEAYRRMIRRKRAGQ